MKTNSQRGAAVLAALCLSSLAWAQTPAETPAQRDARMAWWREARFGLFIHWGLYAIPAGEWGGATHHGEWIRHSAHIPLEEYDPLVAQFNPVQFDADEWVSLAKAAGMKYIVITSKHHDGFCLFDSQYTDYDVMATPFGRDILAELSAACQRQGLRMCWYHSIMDWHHPDYLPRRPWETRSAEGADFDRFRTYLKNQVRELLTNYGPIGVLWFDGEWEESWNHEYGRDVYYYVRGIDPKVIINNRVDKGRAGMAGMTTDPDFCGDFGTPEQEIPATGWPGVDWETCMTMNDHWGYNRADDHWKSSAELIRMLCDIASKGGNFLLNVGPTAEGEFPPACVERLRAIGQWMDVNGEAIHGTQAGPFPSLSWGRCTQKPLPDGNTRLYLHVFDWPADGRLRVPGIFNEAKRAYLLAAPGGGDNDVPRGTSYLKVDVPRGTSYLELEVGPKAPDAVASVVVLDISGRPDIAQEPDIAATCDIFLDDLEVRISSGNENDEPRYTLDGSEPTAESALAGEPIRLRQSTTIRARSFRGKEPASAIVERTFQRVTSRPAVSIEGATPGLAYEYFEGNWERLPDFDKLEPVTTGEIDDFSFAPRRQDEHFAFRYRGFVRVPREGVYRFFTTSDDGSRLYIGEELVVDNDGLHGAAEAVGVVALAAGLHPLTVGFFERSGDDMLEVWYEGPGIEKCRVPASALVRE